MNEDEIDRVVDRVSLYNEKPERIYEFGQRYPIFPKVIADLLHSGMNPEEITLDFVEKRIRENIEYREKNLAEFLNPFRRSRLWEFGGTE